MGYGRERVTDTSSSRVVLSVERTAHMVKLRPTSSPFVLSRFDRCGDDYGILSGRWRRGEGVGRRERAKEEKR